MSLAGARRFLYERTTCWFLENLASDACAPLAHGVDFGLSARFEPLALVRDSQFGWWASGRLGQGLGHQQP